MTATLERPAGARLAPPARKRLSLKALLVVAVVIALHVLAYRRSEISIGEFFSDFHNISEFFVSPDLSWSATVHPAITGAILTFSIGLMGTTLALPLALVFAVLGSRTMSPNRTVFQIVRLLMSILRAVPSFIFAIIFIAVVGLGPYPGVLGLLVHGIGVTAKLWWDAIDEADQGPVEALRTTGASRIQVLQHAVFPIVTPSLASLALFRLDDNVRSALVLGLTGAGGIGQLIDGSVQEFAYAAIVTQIVVILIMIVAIDQLASYVARRLAASR